MEPTQMEHLAGYKLIESGSLVAFDITETQIEPSPNGEDISVQIELHLGEQEEEGYRSDDHEWGGFGFIFCLAILSFRDARPRGVSGVDFEETDSFTVVDLLDHLRYTDGELRCYFDYIRGRCVKTDIRVRPDGTATLRTHGRGETATRWLRLLAGKKLMQLVD